MEAGGKIKATRSHPSSKPYSRSAGLLGRVSESVKEMLSPSWLVDLVSSVKKKTPPPEIQQSQQRDQCSAYENFSASRPEPPDFANSYLPPPGVAPAPSYNAQFQHSTPAPQHSHDAMHLPNSAVSLAGLNKLDLQFNLLANGSDEHSELNELTPSTNAQYSQGMQSATNPSGVGGNNKYFNEAHSKIQQLRQELGGSVTPSKEIEERGSGKLQTQISEGKAVPQVQPSSFLWASETRRELKKNTPQPPAKRHKPNFSSAVFGSTSFGMNQTVDQSISSSNHAFHNSSFYPGKTMFGGASANKNRAKPSAAYQVTPSRKQVTAKTSSQARAGVTSSAAKRILDCLERMSTPLSDAKKIPSYNSSSVDSPLSFTPGVYRRRSVRQAVNKNAPPVVNMSTPTQASIGRNLQRPSIKVQERTGDSKDEETSTAIKQPSYEIGNSHKDSDRKGGKMKRERSTFHSSKRGQQDDEEEVEAPALPTGFTLPISDKLPSFDFSGTSKTATEKAWKPEFVTSSPIVSDSREKTMDKLPFTFSSPIAEGGASLTVADSDLKKSPFTFSSPISVDKQAPTSDAASGIISSAPSMAFTFTPTSKLKVKPQPASEEKSSGGLKPATELKRGGVMDILGTPSSGPSPAKSIIPGGSVMDLLGKQSNTNTSESKQAPLSSRFQKATTASAGSSSEINTKITSSAPPLSTLFQTDSGWSCPTCMVQNKDSMDKCPCCETAKPGPKVTKAATKTVPSSSASSNVAPLSSLFQSASGWSCPMCMVQNKDDMEKCPCCDTPKPGGTSSQTSSKPTGSLSKFDTLTPGKQSLAEMFKKPTGNWDCDTCMVSNKPAATKCIACETPKPGLKPSTSFTSAGGFTGIKFGYQPDKKEESKSDTSGFSFGTTAKATDISKAGISFGMKSSDNGAVSSTGIKFGVSSDDSAKKDTKTIDSKATSGSTGGIRFGTGSTDMPITTGFGFSAPKVDGSEKKAETKSGNDSKSTSGVVGFQFDAKTVKDNSNKDTPAFTGFGTKSSVSEGKDTNNKSSLVFGTPKTDSTTDTAKPTASVPGFQFSAKSENKTSNVPVFGSGTSVTGSGATDKPSVVSSSGLFGSNNSSANKVTSDTDTTKSSAPASIFGNTGASVTASAATSTSSSVTSFVFGSQAAAPSTASSSTGTFSASSTPAKPVAASTFGGFATSTDKPATSSGTSTGGFTFNAGSKPNSSTSSSVSSTSTFSGFGATAAAPTSTKTDESKPSSGLFVFGPQSTLKADSTADSKSLGAGGFAFGAPAAQGQDKKAGEMFAFADKSVADSSSSNLKRGRDTGSEGSSAKKGTNVFGSGTSSVFGQPSANGSSVFGSSTVPAFGSTTPSSLFGSGSTPASKDPPAPASSGFGSGAVFGGATGSSQGAVSSGFSFAAATGQAKPADATAPSGLFQFGATPNQSSNNSLGNSNPFGQASQQPTANSTTPAFGSQPSGTPAFGSQPANPPAFGSKPDTTPAFGSQSNAANPSAGGFNFNVGAANFNFGGNAAPSGNSFQFSAQPAATNTMFSAGTTSSSATPARRTIKKAVRRTARK